ncbi:hypothetical protein WJX75_007724 [Coccomyxa subellipsoidea]|uniref:Auto-transporter adhesin head GIN domain-containing protein n=1 Tax=Coccomyxa subellipsoidea TaxID=248742 RepID=A0ABR2YD99_9CHLO
MKLQNMTVGKLNIISGYATTIFEGNAQQAIVRNTGGGDVYVSGSVHNATLQFGPDTDLAYSRQYLANNGSIYVDAGLGVSIQADTSLNLGTNSCWSIYFANGTCNVQPPSAINSSADIQPVCVESVRLPDLQFNRARIIQSLSNLSCVEREYTEYEYLYSQRSETNRENILNKLIRELNSSTPSPSYTPVPYSSYTVQYGYCGIPAAAVFLVVGLILHRVAKRKEVN